MLKAYDKNTLKTNWQKYTHLTDISSQCVLILFTPYWYFWFTLEMYPYDLIIISIRSICLSIYPSFFAALWWIHFFKNIDSKSICTMYIYLNKYIFLVFVALMRPLNLINFFLFCKTINFFLPIYASVYIYGSMMKTFIDTQ